MSYNGFDARVKRLGLMPLLWEVTRIVTGFKLLVAEMRHANGTRQIRERIDERFETTAGWEKITSGGIDWSKRVEHGRRIGIEVQVSGRSDMVAVDLLHLQAELRGGALDAGVIVVPDDTLAKYLTDRSPDLSTTIRHVERIAPSPALQVVAIRHDGEGPALPKARTNQGKTP